MRTCWILFFRSFVLGSSPYYIDARLTLGICCLCGFYWDFFGFLLPSLAFCSRIFVTNLVTIFDSDQIFWSLGGDYRH
jgi:hypothetical protein